MNEISANKFKQNFTSEIKKCIENHDILKVKIKDGCDFIVLGAEDWAAIEETIYLNRIPGLSNSIQQAKNEPLELGTKLEELDW